MEKINLIDKHVLNREPVPIKKSGTKLFSWCAANVGARLKKICMKQISLIKHLLYM